MRQLAAALFRHVQKAAASCRTPKAPSGRGSEAYGALAVTMVAIFDRSLQNSRNKHAGGETISFPNKKVLLFDFDVIDLPRMEARSYVKLKNPAALALAARMKMNPQDRVSLARDFFLSLAYTKIKREEKDLVAGFFSRYQPLSDQEDLQLEEELRKVKSKDAREAAMELTNPFIELGKRRGRQEGILEGRHEGQAELVLKLLARRLGSISRTHERAIRKLSAENIEALGEALLDFNVPADLAHWLRQNK